MAVQIKSAGDEIVSLAFISGFRTLVILPKAQPGVLWMVNFHDFPSERFPLDCSSRYLPQFWQRRFSLIPPSFQTYSSRGNRNSTSRAKENYA
jgi:hypothetical protein